MSMIKEFKEFAMKGNVIDLAVGVVIGGAFGKIVTSLVSDIVMPPIGLVIGNVDFSDLKIKLKDADPAKKAAEVDIHYGNFITILIQFIIIAFCIFLIVKGINAMRKKDEAAPAPPAPEPVPTKEEVLLTEI